MNGGIVTQMEKEVKVMGDIDAVEGKREKIRKVSNE